MSWDVCRCFTFSFGYFFSYHSLIHSLSLFCQTHNGVRLSIANAKRYTEDKYQRLMRFLIPFPLENDSLCVCERAVFVHVTQHKIFHIEQSLFNILPMMSLNLPFDERKTKKKISLSLHSIKIRIFFSFSLCCHIEMTFYIVNGNSVWNFEETEDNIFTACANSRLSKGYRKRFELSRRQAKKTIKLWKENKNQMSFQSMLLHSYGQFKSTSCYINSRSCNTLPPSIFGTLYRCEKEN